MSNFRCRNYTLITYHTDEIIKSVLQVNTDRIRHYAYICHDKDIDENGVLKEKHFHLLLQFNNSISLSAVRNLFPVGANTLGQAVRDKSDCFKYLNHSDCPDKYQYPDSDIVCDDLSFWQSVQSGEDDDRTMSIIDDILNGVLFRDLVKRYGRDLVINYNKYYEFARRIHGQEYHPAENIPDSMRVLPDYGGGDQLFIDDNGEVLPKD